MIRGDPYLETAASRPRVVLSSANFAKPTARGGGVPVARGGRTLPAGGVPVASPPLATGMAGSDGVSHNFARSTMRP